MQHPPACPRCGHSSTERSPSGNGWVCRFTWTEQVRGRQIGEAPNMNPLAPGPYPGIPVFEWHAQTISCGTSFTDAEAAEATRRRQREADEKALRQQHQQEARRRVAALERKRDAALREIPAIGSPAPIKEETAGRGCAIGCGLWAVLLVVSLLVLAANGQLSDESDPTIFGVENPLLFLPATWLVGWMIASIQMAGAKGRQRIAKAKADERASERARVEADFDRQIAAVGRAAQQ